MVSGGSLAIRITVTATSAGVDGVATFSTVGSGYGGGVAVTQLVIQDHSAGDTGLVGRTVGGGAGGMFDDIRPIASVRIITFFTDVLSKSHCFTCRSMNIYSVIVSM